MMRGLLTVLLISGMGFGQVAESPKTDGSAQDSTRPVTTSSLPGSPSAPLDPNIVTIPAGTKIPLSLKQAISTKNAREGGEVYSATAFAFVVDERGIVPSGAYLH